MKPLLYLLLLCSISAFAKTETDTITNWQVYKDGKLLFKSNQFEKVNTVTIGKNEDFKALELRVYTDAPGPSTKRYLKFIQNGKVLYTSGKEIIAYEQVKLLLTKQELMFFVGKDAGQTFDIEYSGDGEKLIVFKLAVK